MGCWTYGYFTEYITEDNFYNSCKKRFKQASLRKYEGKSFVYLDKFETECIYLDYPDRKYIEVNDLKIIIKTEFNLQVPSKCAIEHLKKIVSELGGGYFVENHCQSKNPVFIALK